MESSLGGALFLHHYGIDATHIPSVGAALTDCVLQLSILGGLAPERRGDVETVRNVSNEYHAHKTHTHAYGHALAQIHTLKYTQEHTHKHTHKHTRKHTRKHTHKHTYKHTHTHTYTHTNTHTHTHTG